MTTLHTFWNPQGAKRARMTRALAWLVPLALFGATLLTRWLRPDVPTNVDEALWVGRGMSFYIALLEGDLRDTFLRHHPGVINMWVTGGAYALRYTLRAVWPLPAPLADIAAQSQGLLGYLQTLALPLTRTGESLFPLAAYVQARVLAGLLTALTMVGVYLLMKRLFGTRLALLASLFLLTEPFFLAYQRFITTDANQTNFIWLSLLAFLLFLRHWPRPRQAHRWLLLSSVCFGLAMLSKIAAALSVPAIALWALVFWLRGDRATLVPRGKRLFGELLAWGIGALLVIVLLWPALWVDAPGTVARLIEGLRFEVEGHTQFFLGQKSADPGPLFYPSRHAVAPVARLAGGGATGGARARAAPASPPHAAAHAAGGAAG